MDEFVDVSFVVSGVSSFDKVVGLSAISSTGRTKSKGPEELVDILELGSNCEDLVNDIFHADDSVLFELLLDDQVTGEGNALPIELGESALVDKLSDGLEVGISVGNVWFDQTEHLDDRSVQADKGGIMDTTESEKLENLLCLGIDSVDTTDTGNNGKLGLRFQIEVSFFSCSAAGFDFSLIQIAVFLYILLGALKDDLSLLGSFLLKIKEKGEKVNTEAL